MASRVWQSAWYLMGALALQVHAASQVTHVQVLASVSGSVITNRQVQMESVLESPEQWKTLQSTMTAVPDNVQSGHVEQNIDEQALQRLIFQVMVEEENRIFQSDKISTQEIEKELSNFKTALTLSGFNDFKAYFDATDHEIKKKIERRLLLTKALSSRIRYHASSGLPEEQGKVLEEWFSQLKSRYKAIDYRNTQVPTSPAEL